MSGPTSARAALGIDKEVATMPSIAGQLVTEAFEYDGGRQVTVYVRRIRRRRSCSPVTVS